MKKIIILLTTVFAMGLLVGCGASDTADSKDGGSETGVVQGEEVIDIRAGVNTASLAYPYQVALEQGIFEKYNLNVTIDTYESGAGTLDAVILKQEEAASAAGYAIATRLSEDSNLRVVSSLNELTPASEELYTTDKSIQTPKDLEGKTIGVKKGTVDEYIWAKLFETYDVDRSKVTEVGLGSDAEIITAFATGDVDAIWVENSNVEKVLEAVSDAFSLGDLSLTGAAIKVYVAFDSEFIEQKPEGAKRLLQALSEAVDFLSENQEETADIIYKTMKIDKENALSDIQNSIWEIRFSQEDYDSLADIAQWVQDNGVNENKFEISDVVDFTPIQNALPDKVSVE